MPMKFRLFLAIITYARSEVFEMKKLLLTVKINTEYLRIL